MAINVLDFSLLYWGPPSPPLVPVQTGTHAFDLSAFDKSEAWIPAFAGINGKSGDRNADISSKRTALSTTHRESGNSLEPVLCGRHVRENNLKGREAGGQKRSPTSAAKAQVRQQKLASAPSKPKKASALFLHMLQTVHHTGFQAGVGGVGLFLLIVFGFWFPRFAAGLFLAFGHRVYP